MCGGCRAVPELLVVHADLHSGTKSCTHATDKACGPYEPRLRAPRYTMWLLRRYELWRTARRYCCAARSTRHMWRRPSVRIRFHTSECVQTATPQVATENDGAWISGRKSAIRRCQAQYIIQHIDITLHNTVATMQTAENSYQVHCPVCECPVMLRIKTERSM